MKKIGAGVVALLIIGVGALALHINKASLDPRIIATISIPFPQQAHIFAAGDMLFDRQIRIISAAQGDDYPFSCIDSLIQTSDFAVANLEGPITASSSRSVGSAEGSLNNYYFTFPLTTGALLARHDIKAVDIGNNHILNFGIDGLNSTQKDLTDAGVGYFGGVDGNEGIYTVRIHGVPVAFLGYNEFGGSKPEAVAQTITQEVKAGYRVIVYTHWGDEYVDSSARLRPIAELFASAGAAAVIGSHPHVVLGHEYIGDTLVYYSLGNFIFDQYFSDAVDHGMALMLDVPSEGRVTAVEHPVTLQRDGRTCPI